MPPDVLTDLRSRLLEWYAQNARDLPWRRTKDPYRIWVSEIMLQQTQVATVIPYYNRWLERFPDIQSLADAPLEEVLKFWAGLGYYRRVRMIHQAAKTVVEKYGGKFPRTVEELLKLPGIGRYTAGAIASIAFGEPAPILDGNVKRIFARIFAMKEAIDTPKGEKRLWGLAEKLVRSKVWGVGRTISLLPTPYPPTRFSPGDFNQALMELGAAVCLPEKPHCNACPVKSFCRAFKRGRATEFPIKKLKEIAEKLQTAALVLRMNGNVLIQKQPEDGRWGGLWMFPHWPDKKAMMAGLKMLVGSGGWGVRRKNRPTPYSLLPTHLMTVHHGFTKYRIELKVYEQALREKGGQEGRRRGKKGTSLLTPLSPFIPSTPLIQKWVCLHDLSGYPFPSPHKKIVEKLLKDE